MSAHTDTIHIGVIEIISLSRQETRFYFGFFVGFSLIPLIFFNKPFTLEYKIGNIVHVLSMLDT